MRCDLCLNRLCLYKTRSQAAKACLEGRVQVNGQPARAARPIRPGDRIRFQDPTGRFEEEVENPRFPRGPSRGRRRGRWFA